MLIYGGQAYSYANDVDFKSVSTSEDFWQEVIDKYYTKYAGIKKWHSELVSTVKQKGYITIPSGRYYTFQTDSYGKWPITTIKNYAVQGFGADLVMLARIEVLRMSRDRGLDTTCLVVQTVHDSIVVDAPSKHTEEVCHILKTAIEGIPQVVKREFQYDFTLPLLCEIQVGKNLYDMVEFKF